MSRTMARAYSGRVSTQSGRRGLGTERRRTDSRRPISASGRDRPSHHLVTHAKGVRQAPAGAEPRQLENRKPEPLGAGLPVRGGCPPDSDRQRPTYCAALGKMAPAAIYHSRDPTSEKRVGGFGMRGILAVSRALSAAIVDEFQEFRRIFAASSDAVKRAVRLDMVEFRLIRVQLTGRRSDLANGIASEFISFDLLRAISESSAI